MIQTRKEINSECKYTSQQGYWYFENKQLRKQPIRWKRFTDILDQVKERLGLEEELKETLHLDIHK